LKPNGLAILQLDRLRALAGVYPGVEREDEMVAAFDYCLWGKGGAAPSIDTAMHGLVDAPHVDHLHPDSGIALATAAGGEKLTAECFGDRVVWVPWRRPGFQLGLDIAAIAAANPQAIGCILGGHGITAWGQSSDECEARSLEIIRTAEAFIATGGRPEPFGLDFLSRDGHPRLAALGTSCPDHFLRTKVRPMVLDLPPDAPLEDVGARLRELHQAYRADYAAYYQRHATPDSPAMRGADPAIVLVPGIGMFSYGANKRTARVAGEFYINAINVMRGAEALSSYAPIDEAEKFRVNGINPDGVVRGSGIFAAGWGAQRDAVYGVEEKDLGAYYAQRTLLKREVLPDHVADAVFALAGGDLSQTTGLHIPVDSGVAAGFLR
jgi:rhamnose utilization protein RhaD (predicted bifunctional aldolase and dehydrogenase)